VADNVAITTGAGPDKSATDDISGVHYQRVKLALGADGVWDGDVSASNPLPIKVVTQAKTSAPASNDDGVVVRQAPLLTWAVSFSEVGSSLLSSSLTQRRLGTGMGVSQSGGNLVVTTGTTANSEFLARSTETFRGAFIKRAKTILSQRIANNNFAVMLADLIGEGLSCTINSATSIRVTKTAHGFTADNIGQSMMVGAINGAAGAPGRYAISGVPDANNIDFTVSGWPASGSCTVDLFGWNYIWTNYSGATATQTGVDSQRRGWNSGNTTATINTTASPGHVMQTAVQGRNIAWSDMLVASATAPTVTTRASRFENIPDPDVDLYLYLWSWNGTSAPASTTTWTVGFVAVEDAVDVPVYLAGVRPSGLANPIPVVQAAAGPSQPVSFTQPALVAGTAAIGDVGQQYRANATGAASGTHIVSAATTNATVVKASAGRVLGWHLANTTASWRYAKLHNQTTTPTAGSGVVRTIGIPPNGVADFALEGGIAFSTGIGLTIVTGSADADATAVAAGDVVGDLFFA
jgi:hypothetical protein